MTKLKKTYIENNIDMSLEDVLGDRFGRYSKYIIQERALPDARDGLKPVQRRILYAMYHEKNTSDKPYRKSAKTVGIVIGNYHPHGDSSVYEAMVRMSQNWKMNHKLVDMHGNNGSIDDDPAAAMRYTEARLDSITDNMLKDLDYETVLYAPNFDDTEEEPTVLPSMFPLLLINGATGIASGYATNIAPHNLNEIIDAAIYLLHNNQASVDELLQFVKGPDFPTGGIVQGAENIKDVFSTGKGRVVVRAKTSIEYSKTLKQIVITEIPYEVVKSDLVKQMDDIRINKDIDGITDVRDESDRNGLRIVIDLKNGTDENLILNYFYKNTNLQIYYNYNMVAIINKRPVQCSLYDLINAFVTFRKQVVLKRSNYLLTQYQKRLNVLEGLIKAVSIMDDIIDTIRSSDNKAEAKDNIIEKFLFNDDQAEAIVTLRLYRLTNTDVIQLKQEYAKLVNECETLKAIINNESILNSVINNELLNVKKEYGRDRLTTIENDISEIVIDKTKMIQNDTVMVSLSKEGYLKRSSLRSFNASDNLVPGLKDNDQLLGTIQCELLDTLLIFTDRGNYGYLPIYQINDFKWKDVGDYLSTYMKLEPTEKIIDAILVKNFDTFAYILSISKNGNTKKTLVKDYVLQRNSKLSVNMKIKADDSVVKVIIVYPNFDLLFTSRDGFNVRFNERHLSNLGNKSQGVKAMKLAKDDYLANVSTLANNESYVLLFENGKMKRIKNEDIITTNRAVKGDRLIKKFKNNQPVITNGINTEAYTKLLFIDNDLIEIQAKDIPLMSKEASTSSVLELTNYGYYIKGIQEAIIVDKPDNYQELLIDEEVIEEDYTQLSLF